MFASDNSQNCGVRIALAADTLAVVSRSPVSSSVGGVQPSGCQPSAGRRTTNAPIIIETRYTAPSVRNEGTIASTGLLAKISSNVLESGEAISAPPPKPMMARPVARPGRSGNHLISVETGEICPTPSPIPPTPPYPKYPSHNCEVATPSAPMAKPPDQHR